MESYVITREGKKLFCRVEGEGKPLLLIHGSIVDADFYADLSQHLSRFYKVISYDRRGYSRSDECENYGLQKQVEDACAILRQLAGEKAIVVGCSLGALISMRLTAFYPELVDTVILHEPPMLCLSDVTSAEEAAALQMIKTQVERGRFKSALLGFLELTNGKTDMRAKAYSPQKIDQQLKNGVLFMKYEFAAQFFSGREVYGIDSLKGRNGICCMAGDSSGDTYTVKAAHVIAAELGCPIFYVPGGHNAAHDLPKEFAAILLGMLRMYGM